MLVLAAGAAVSVAQADLFYNFETDAQGFTKGTWSATGPASQGVGSLNAGATAGGWQWTVEKNFDQPGEREAISTMAGFGAGATLQFDIIVDHTRTFPAGVDAWFQINLAANSQEGTGTPASPGWAQFADIFKPDGWHDQNNTATQTKTLTFTFPQLGWEPDEPWYQLNLGANSDAAVPVGFYVDNVKLTVVPEPSTLNLGVLAISLLLARRRFA